MSAKQGFIIDLDGTLYRGSEILPHAVAFMESIRTAELPFLLMTNNSTRTPEEVAGHLCALGIPAEANEIFTSSQASVRYMDEAGRGKRVFCIGEHGLVKELEKAGYTLTEYDADYVLQGLDRGFDYAKLHKALELIQSGAAFIQTNPDVRLPMDTGFLPGAGSIGAAIAAATGVQPTVVGKPSLIMMGYALEQLGLAASDVWMVGDNMRTDMSAGKAAACRTALLLTGVTNTENLSSLEEETGFQCDFVGHHLGEFMRYLRFS